MIKNEYNLNMDPTYIRFVNKIQELAFTGVSPNEIATYNDTIYLDEAGIQKEYRLFANIMKQDVGGREETPPKSRPIDEYNLLVFFIEDVDQMENIFQMKTMYFAG